MERFSMLMSIVLSFAAGLATATVIDFMLYRMTLPLKPFIYVAF